MKILFTKPVSAIPICLTLMLCIYSFACFSQTEQRIKFNSITSSVNTGMDYSPWLNDNVDSLVQQVWLNNFVWVDVTLKLTQHSKITRLSFYDYEGVFTDAPDSIYALNGTTKTFLGTFTGPGYMIWDGFTLDAPVEADAFIIHKFSNNIPQKVDIFGYPDTTTVTTPPITPIDTNQIVKIPIDTTRWFQLTNASGGLGGLFDGDLTTMVNTGWGKLITNYDAYYPVMPGEKIDLYSMRFYNYEGSLGPYPLTVSVIDSVGNRTLIGTYSGGGYMTWDGPRPGDTSKLLTTAMKNVKFIVLNCWYQFPTEIEFYGHYTAPPAVTPLVQKGYPLNQYFGVNAFEWNFEDPNSPLVVSPTLLAAAESFTQVRHYMDWNKLESTQGMYTFNPVHSGGWNYDAIYQACQANNMVVLGDLKTMPDWMIATYPAGQQDSENVPVPYGSDFSDPNSYILQAKVAYQYAARYGSNGAVSSSTLSVDTSIRWTNDPKNIIKKGTGLVQYIECDNERDKWWKGRQAYQTSYEYAANLSAFYDGNKNTMGPGVGVKNADPNIQVVMGGIASADPGYVHGMIEWCRLHRGYRADGTVNICWDVINYHLYPNDSYPEGYATTGVAPERSIAAKTAQSFIQMAHQYAADMPVWVTETGYDMNQGSIQKAPPIGSKTAALVEADWILRTSLLYARNGIARVFFYEEYDDNAAAPTQYASSGLINDDKSRRPAADYLYQANKLFGNYTYKQTLNSSPIVDQYLSTANQPAYVLVMPTQTGSTVNYSLDLGTADSAYVYTPTAGANDMASNKVKLTGGKLSLNVTETPTFVVPSGVAETLASNLAKLSQHLADATQFDSSITLYPNPTAKYATVALNNNINGDITIKVTDVNQGKVYATYTSAKSGSAFSQTIDISNIPVGVCVVQVTQGTKQSFKKVIKTY
jgi:endoglucanase